MMPGFWEVFSVTFAYALAALLALFCVFLIGFGIIAIIDSSTELFGVHIDISEDKK